VEVSLDSRGQAAAGKSGQRRTSRAMRSSASSWATSRSYWPWRPTQNSAVVPIYLARRRANSALTLRRPWISELTAAGATPRPSATAADESFKGFMNSSRSTSPGWTGGSLIFRLLMDFNDSQQFLPGVHRSPASGSRCAIGRSDHLSALPIGRQEMRSGLPTVEHCATYAASAAPQPASSDPTAARTRDPRSAQPLCRRSLQSPAKTTVQSRRCQLHGESLSPALGRPRKGGAVLRWENFGE